MEEKLDLTTKSMKTALWSYLHTTNSGIDFEVDLPGNAGKADCIGLDILNRVITLVEIKRSRSDFRQGFPKLEEYNKVAHLCYLACPPDIIPIEEVPEGWGLFHFTADFGELIEVIKPTMKSCPSPFFDRYVKLILERARDHKYFYYSAKKVYEKQLNK